MDKRQRDRHNKIDDFTKEEKLSGGAVFEIGVKPVSYTHLTLPTKA